MRLDKEKKEKILTKLKQEEQQSGLSAARFASRLGISGTAWSRLKSGNFAAIAEGRFISLAREYAISFSEQEEWHTAKTQTFQYIYKLLETCHRESISALLVDMADIGKTHTAKYYVRNNENAVYLDCSQCKSKQRFVRALARQFGVSSTGRYVDVYDDLVFYLNSLSEHTLIVLDEAGDLNYDAFLECKALWNATEGNVGWVKIGADGLKAKIERAINCKKVGYAEVLRRYGSQFRRVTPLGKEAREEFLLTEAAMVSKANLPANSSVDNILKSSRQKGLGDLQRRAKVSLTNIRSVIKVLKQKTA